MICMYYWKFRLNVIRFFKALRNFCLVFSKKYLISYVNVWIFFMSIVVFKKIFPEKSELPFLFIFFSNICYVYACVFYMIVWYFLIIWSTFVTFLWKISSPILCEFLCVYVTANLRNQIFPGIPNPLRESGESLKWISS